MPVDDAPLNLEGYGRILLKIMEHALRRDELCAFTDDASAGAAVPPGVLHDLGKARRGALDYLAVARKRVDALFGDRLVQGDHRHRLVTKGFDRARVSMGSRDLLIDLALIEQGDCGLLGNESVLRRWMLPKPQARVLALRWDYFLLCFLNMLVHATFLCSSTVTPGTS